MDDLIKQNFAIFVPLLFVPLWLTVTSILGLLSGWYRLAARYPDQADEASLRLSGRSGVMGPGVGMRGVLTLSVCPSGLRIGMMRVFGPFCRNFFVPWQDIAAIRKTSVFWPMVELRFGDPAIGRLRIAPRLADKLATAASGRWPKAESLPEETRGAMFRRLLLQWAALTGGAALFFTLVPLALAPSGGGPPVLAAILFPAIVFGVVAIVKFLRRMD